MHYFRNFSPGISTPAGRCISAALVFAFLIAASLFAAGAPDAAEVPGVRRVDYFGYAGCLQLENHMTRVVLCHQAGGRVLEYSLHGVNAIWLDPAHQGWVMSKDSAFVDLSGGRFDIGPEMLVPPRHVLWMGPWRAEVIGPRWVRLTSEEDAATGVQLVREFKLDAASSWLHCTQIIRNVSKKSTTWCHWSRTFAMGGGIVVIPQTPDGRFPNGYVMYERGNLIDARPNDPNIRTRDGFLEIVGPPKFPKLGMDSQAGWFAYLMPNDLLFIKRFPVHPERVYNEVASLTVSIWYDRTVRCELEPIGPSEKLAPGESASFTEDWRLEPFSFPAPGQSANLKQIATLAGP